LWFICGFVIHILSIFQNHKILKKSDPSRVDNKTTKKYLKKVSKKILKKSDLSLFEEVQRVVGCGPNMVRPHTNAA